MSASGWSGTIGCRSLTSRLVSDFRWSLSDPFLPVASGRFEEGCSAATCRQGSVAPCS